MINACNRFNSLSYPVLPTLFLEFHGSSKSLEEQVSVTGVCVMLYDEVWSAVTEVTLRTLEIFHTNLQH